MNMFIIIAGNRCMDSWSFFQPVSCGGFSNGFSLGKMTVVSNSFQLSGCKPGSNRTSLFLKCYWAYRSFFLLLIVYMTNHFLVSCRFYFDFSLTYVGAGMICSHLVNLSLLFGAVLSYGLMWPLINRLKGDWFSEDLQESSMESLYGYKVSHFLSFFAKHSSPGSASLIIPKFYKNVYGTMFYNL